MPLVIRKEPFIRHRGGGTGKPESLGVVRWVRRAHGCLAPHWLQISSLNANRSNVKTASRSGSPLQRSRSSASPPVPHRQYTTPREASKFRNPLSLQCSKNILGEVPKAPGAKPPEQASSV